MHDVFLKKFRNPYVIDITGSILYVRKPKFGEVI